ncbi:MAG: hypothetical protein VXZ96_16890 [Myxococcota bacterium]|nr:hypothetical protein [Myxococcota bacterium]
MLFVLLSSIFGHQVEVAVKPPQPKRYFGTNGVWLVRLRCFDINLIRFLVRMLH